MKRISLFVIINLIGTAVLFAQNTLDKKSAEKKIYVLIENYTKSRETRDTTLLNSILTSDIDQLVSSGEWRHGKEGAKTGMMRSSTNNPGERTITIEQIRFINPDCAIVDAKYKIQNADGTARNMWSTFIVVYKDDIWKITAIRNMLPAG